MGFFTKKSKDQEKILKETVLKEAVAKPNYGTTPQFTPITPQSTSSAFTISGIGYTKK